MIGTYAGLWGALIGVVAVPSRLVPQAFQESWLAMTALTLGIVVVGLVGVAAVIRILGGVGVPEHADPAGRVAPDLTKA
jgi:hypothetical protein